MAQGFINKLNHILSDELANFRSGLERGASNDRVTGFVISSDFDRLSHTQRQRRLATILERRLSEGERNRVGPIVTMSQAEAA